VHTVYKVVAQGGYRIVQVEVSVKFEGLRYRNEELNFDIIDCM